MNLTRRGRTWAAVAFTAVLATAATIGLLVPALSASTTTGNSLEATVSRALDAAEAGDPFLAIAADPDCFVTTASLAEATAMIQGWSYTLESVRYQLPTEATVTVTGTGPDRAGGMGPFVDTTQTTISTWSKTDGTWRMTADGSC